MSKVLVDRILQRYGLKGASIRDAMKGYRNESYACELPDGRLVNLIIYKREDGILHRIRCADSVSNFLASLGMPARASADPRIVRLQSGAAIKYAALYEYLPGKTIPWEAYTKEHLKQLGAVMGDMHAALIGFDGTQLPHVADEYLAILKRMEAYFADRGVQTALRRKLQLILDASAIAKLEHLLHNCRDLPGQALHMDFVRGNILFSPSPAVTGVLDFEKTALGHPAFDVARTLAFLLVDCKYKSEAEVRKYFLYSGYTKRGKAALPPVRLINALIPLFLLHDFYKFLRHNPYESLERNEHFVRTRDLLLKRNILSHTKVLK